MTAMLLLFVIIVAVIGSTNTLTIDGTAAAIVTGFFNIAATLAIAVSCENNGQ